MAEMVERVARAMATPQMRRTLAAAGLAFEAGQDAFLEGFARLAIEAMNEPTPEMVAATVPFVDRPDDAETTRLAERALFLLEGPDFPAQGHQDGLTSAKDVIRDYRAMIDAALKETAG